MKQFKTIMIKEFQLHKWELLLPLLILGGVYLLLVFVYLYALIRGHAQIDLSGMCSTNDPVAAVQVYKVFNYSVQMFQALLAGFMAFIPAMVMSEQALNQEYRHKCARFYAMQPVSVEKTALAKYTVAVLCNLPVMIIVALFNGLVATIILTSQNQFYWQESLLGFWQGILISFLVIIHLGSLSFLGSAIFRRKANRGSILAVVIASVSAIVVNNVTVLHLPVIIKWFVYPLIRMFEILQSMPKGQDWLAANQSWSMVFCWQNLIYLAVAAGYFYAAVYIQKRRQIN